MELNLNEPQSHGGSTSRLAIECPRAVLEQILAHVDRGFYSVPHGGAEEGGVLYGSYDGSRILIQAARPLQCEHANGPSSISLARITRVWPPCCCPRRANRISREWRWPVGTIPIPAARFRSPMRTSGFTTGSSEAVAGGARPEAPCHEAHRSGLFVREADGRMHRSEPAAEASLTLARAGSQ